MERGFLSQQNYQLIVAFCDTDENLQDEMTFEDFERLLSGSVLLESHAASSLKCCYCVVGQGLQLVALVYFTLKVDENGVPDSGFNLPLMYLAEQAGVEVDLGHGGIRVASRGRCAVPWHSLNLWDAESDDFVSLLQKRIFRNRLNLKHVIKNGTSFCPEAPVQNAETSGVRDRAPSGQKSVKGLLNEVFTDRLEEVFGATGKLTLQDMIRLHSDQLAEAKQRFRTEIEDQQGSYLNQLREVRDEIQDLKVALRQEQSRNRRLQQMLRGEP
ncbi:MAG: hypothetical protein ACI96M_002101 [Candidatus Azotimanducaceae bacterium]|jgi:hypothetical protein